MLHQRQVCPGLMKGDKMNGNAQKLIKYMDGASKRFIIPVYQRNYDWKMEHCKQLYDDLVKVIQQNRRSKHLQELIPSLVPMRMSGAFVDKFHQKGLLRSEKYLSRLRLDMQNGEYPLFEDAITEILKYEITVEQEIFLT